MWQEPLDSQCMRDQDCQVNLFAFCFDSWSDNILKVHVYLDGLCSHECNTTQHEHF